MIVALYRIGLPQPFKIHISIAIPIKMIFFIINSLRWTLIFVALLSFNLTKKRKRAPYISSSRLRIQTAHWFPLPWQFFDYSFIIENLISLLAYFLSCLLLRLYYNKFIASMSILFGKFRTMEAELSAKPFPKSQAIVLQKFIKGGRSRFRPGLSSLISLSFSGSEEAAVFCP